MAAMENPKEGGGGVAGTGPVKGETEMAEVAEASMDTQEATDALRKMYNDRFDAGLEVYGPDRFAATAASTPWQTGFDELLNTARNPTK